MKTYEWKLKNGISRTKEFEKKGLAQFAINIRRRHNWSDYIIRLIRNVQQSIRKYYDINKLKFLQYPSGLKPKDIAEIEKDDAGVA